MKNYDELTNDLTKRKKRKRVITIIAPICCFCLIALIGFGLWQGGFFDSGLLAPSNNSTQNDKRYKDVSIYIAGDAIIWPWEYLTESEKYYKTEIDGVKYEKNSGRALSKDLIGDKIGAYSIVGRDGISGEQHKIVCDVYQLKNVDKTQYLAVEIADNYYVFKNAVYNPPKTLGELFQRLDLSAFVKLERFSKNDTGPNAKHFILEDDAYIWDILNGCKNAVFIDQDQEYWHMYEREFISFTISCEALGMYKHHLSVTADGYLSTNAFEWGYLYYIGEENSQKIIQYAMKNSKKAEYEPYDNNSYICGQVVEISDDYILVDDSILCKNSADGIKYKVLLNNLKISRYVDRQVIKVGSKVQISYTGEIDEQNAYTIDSAFSVTKVSISGKEVLLDE